MMQEVTLMKRKVFPCELAFMLALLLCGFCTALAAKANLGLSSLGLLAFVLNTLLPAVSYGAWNYLTQCVAMLVLVFLMRRIKLGYILSFVLAAFYGVCIDFFGIFLSFLPDTLSIRIVCFVGSYIIGAASAAFLVLCRLPIFPFDTFIREVTQRYRVSYKVLRTSIDMGCLLVAAVLGALFMGGFPGIGMGTIFLSFFLGFGADKVMAALNRRFVFLPRFYLTRKFIEDGLAYE